MICLFALNALGADFSGTYKAEVDTSTGKIENKLVLKITGETVSGTLTNQFGELPLQAGAIDESDLFFFVVVKDEGHDFRMVYRGHIFDDEIQFKIEAGERQLEMVAKRVA